MTDMTWVARDVVLALHDEQLAEHGGAEGIRDQSALDSALMRPQNLAAYDDSCDPAALAAAYLYGLCQNHPFVDGNKRAAFVTAVVFLRLNGYRLTATDHDCVVMVWRVADGRMSEEKLITWFQKNIKPL